MDHAVRIPEMGVSKVLYQSFVYCMSLWTHLTLKLCLFQFHAEVYFDQEQQSYMLVDQGSQNGTVINGNRILQVSPLFIPSYPTKTAGLLEPPPGAHDLFPAA